MVRHPNADALNAYLFEMVVNMERIELDLWKRGISPTLKLIKEGMDGESDPEVDFRSFAQRAVAESRRKERRRTCARLWGRLSLKGIAALPRP